MAPVTVGRWSRPDIRASVRVSDHHQQRWRERCLTKRATASAVVQAWLDSLSDAEGPSWVGTDTVVQIMRETKVQRGVVFTSSHGHP